MFAQSTEICWRLVTLITKSKFLTNEYRRPSKTSKTFIQVRHFGLLQLIIYIDFVHCVRWSPTGDMIASSSLDTTAKLTDLRTEKVLYSGATPDGSNLLFEIRNTLMRLLDYANSVCFI